MEQIIFRPKLYKFDTLKAFTYEFKVGGSDLILTNKYIYDPYSDNNKCGAQVIYQEEFGGGEPTDTMVDAIIAEASKKHFERVIAIGGGTVIDIAKVLSVSDGGSVDSLYDHKDSITKLHQLIIIPTTCGTGSEVTNISIINRTRLGVKMGLTSENMFADYAVLVPELLAKLPLKVFGASSIDALVHAGFAFGTAGCAAVHALSYPLGGTYHVPHGESNYALFTGVLYKYMEKKQDGEIAHLNAYLAELLHCDVKNVYNELENLLNHILPKKPLHEYGVTEADIPVFTENVLATQGRLTANNFVPLSRDDILDIYKKLY